MDTRDLQQLYVVLSLLGLMSEQEAAVEIALLSTSSAKPWFLDDDVVQHTFDVMLEADQLWLEDWIAQRLEDLYARAARDVEAVKRYLPDGRVQIYVKTCRQTQCFWLAQMPAADELVAKLCA